MMNSIERQEGFGLARLDTEPENVHEAIDRIARIKAVQGWLADAERLTRSWVTVKADEIEAMTGAAFRAPVTGVGNAYVTDPQPSVIVTDPYQVSVKCDEFVRDVKETYVEPEALDMFVLTYDSGDVEQAARVFRNAISTRSRRYLPDDFAERRVADGDWTIAGDHVVDTATGEIVAGATVKPAGKRTLTVKIDADYLKRLSRQFMQQLGRGDDDA
jgi:LEA14-like dessication related protein